MKNPFRTHSGEGKPEAGLALRGGGYSLAVTALVLAILIVVNIFAGLLPSHLTQLDISSSKLYSITSNTKVVVNNLQKDVTIYWIVQSDQEDDVIRNLLDKYESLSDHITVVKKNPDVFPTFTQTYTAETVRNNSLIVESGDKYRYIAYDDIYLQESGMYSYTYATSFDGEGAITSAIDYCVSDDLPVIYRLQGHGEGDLPATFADQVEKENMTVSDLSLLTVDEIPEDADAILIYAPQSDISETEADMLSQYVTDGGKLLVLAGPVEDGSLTNLNSILAQYQVTVQEGVVVEGDREHYGFGYPYVLLPDLTSSPVTDSLMESHYYAILPIAQGMKVTGEPQNATVTQLLTTSDSAFSKLAGFSLSTYDKEDGDIDGPFALGVSIAHDSGGQIIWFSSSSFLEDMYNAFSSGANTDLSMNALSQLIGESEAMAIRSKSLNYNYLTISDSTASTLKTLMIGVFPLTYLAIGIWVMIVRRKHQNESV